MNQTMTLSIVETIITITITGVNFYVIDNSLADLLVHLDTKHYD